MTMTRGRGALPLAPARPSIPLAATVALAAGVLLLVPVGTVLARPHTAWAAGSASPTLSWSNGPILCQFDTTKPMVNVSATAVNGSGVTSTLGAIAELRGAAPTPVSEVLLAGSWTIQNRTTEDNFVMAYSANLSEIDLTATPSHALGLVQVELLYTLPLYAQGNVGTNAVTLNVSIANWTWTGTGDRVALSLPFAVPAGSGQSMAPTPAGGVTVSAPWSSDRSMFVTPGTQATLSRPGGAPLAAPVTPQVVLAGGQAVVQANLTSASGGFTSFGYSAVIGAFVPAKILGLPWYDYVAVAGLAGLTALLIAGVTRRVRRAPPDLMYVEEEQ